MGCPSCASSPRPPARRVNRSTAACATAAALLAENPLSTSLAPRVAVFGGSGFIGRRVCETLVAAGCDVVSVSKSGRPPPYWASGPWVDRVDWMTADLSSLGGSDEGDGADDDRESLLRSLGRIESSASLIGNVKPNPGWVKSSFFGLGFDDEALRSENGHVNEAACRLSKDAGASRFAFVSVSYEVAKALEGPIPGYLDGKRSAERAAAATFGDNRTFVVGPSLVYGGKRFPRLGDLYRRFVESAPARSYLASQNFLRNLSSTPLEDWLEKMIFSPPVHVDDVARCVCAGALGCIEEGMVPPRRQGFFDTNGKPVTYDNVVFVDGTKEIESISKKVGRPESLAMAVKIISDSKDRTSNEIEQRDVSTVPDAPVASSSTPSNRRSDADEEEPPFEGALVGLLPFLYPVPVAATFLSIFLAIATGQFDALNASNQIT